MERLPAAREAEVIEPEIVGLEPPPPSLWRRLLVRTAMSLILGVLGIGFCLGGGVLTITVIGAGVGVPLLFLGFSLIALALLFVIGGGKAAHINLRFPRP